MAKKGHKVTWIITQPRWGLIINDKIEITCVAIKLSSPQLSTTQSTSLQLPSNQSTSLLLPSPQSAYPLNNKKRKLESGIAEESAMKEAQPPPKKCKIESSETVVETSVTQPKSTSSDIPLSKSDRQLLLLLDYKGIRKKMQITVSSVQNLIDCVRKNLNIDCDIRLEYEDEDFS
eukprot:TRINITY_DN2979_c0_g3_i1.p1 TRINITY_DN2979_c0_g3~~TRINITY_DN2979_c0_g3_i1.p1  ORF type:complete len:175 (+),score=22.92 TRINITY_DN2979_c0_g3_i1:365-889(+)